MVPSINNKWIVPFSSSPRAAVCFYIRTITQHSLATTFFFFFFTFSLYFLTSLFLSLIRFYFTARRALEQREKNIPPAGGVVWTAAPHAVLRGAHRLGRDRGEQPRSTWFTCDLWNLKKIFIIIYTLFCFSFFWIFSSVAHYDLIFSFVFFLFLFFLNERKRQQIV